jgi:predicted hotdog family 3-hydroxylacyl-ACP dehydratase
MAADLPALETLVPHRRPMLLLDRLLFDDGQRVRVGVTVRADALFVRQGAWPSWTGVELMAQAIAAWGGLRRTERGEAVRVGFLLGTRRYRGPVDGFPVGAQLTVEAEQELVTAQGLGVFACRILEGEVVRATASLNVFQPDDVQAYLAEARHE